MDIFRSVYDTARKNLMTEDDIDALTYGEWKEFETLEPLESSSPVGRECVEIVRAAAAVLKLVAEPLARVAIVRAVVLEMVTKYAG